MSWKDDATKRGLISALTGGTGFSLIVCAMGVWEVLKGHTADAWFDIKIAGWLEVGVIGVVSLLLVVFRN